MTTHDRIRMEKAQDANQDDLDSMHDAIAALQSTDDPDLVPMHDEMLKRYRKLEEEKEDAAQRQE